MKIFVNGTFDLLHPGHLALFEYAKSLGDTLLVAIDSDERVKKLKGHKRPINDVTFRAKMLLGLKYIDGVEVFNSDDELINIIRDYKPDIMIVGSDYEYKNVIGSQYAKKLIFFERQKEYSSTKIIQDISNGGQLP